MGGHPWWYLVPYDEDVAKCLEALRRQEFEAGRYNPAEPFPRFPVDQRHRPGRAHASVTAACAAADADGTRSILDMTRVAAKPDFGAVAPLDESELTELFGTVRPSAADVEESEGLFDALERGQGAYIVVYEDDEPSHIFFAGYSYD